MGTAALVILGLAAVLVLWLIGAYNGLVNMRQRCKQAFGDIDVQLKQRQDLVPNLVETVKGYAKHEKETLENVIKWRNAAQTATGPAAQAAAAGRPAPDRTPRSVAAAPAPTLAPVGALPVPEVDRAPAEVHP